MKTQNQKKKVQVEVTDTMQSVCKHLGITASELFEQMQADLTGESGRAGEYFTMLIQLYVSERISRKKNIDRGTIEDFLAQVASIRKQLLRQEFDTRQHPAPEKAVKEYCSAMKKGTVQSIASTN